MNHLPRTALAAALLSVAAAATTHAAIERRVEKAFVSQPGGTLQIETHAGNIEVVPSADMSVHVTAIERFRTDSNADADNLLQKLTLVIEQDGTQVTATARYEDGNPGFHFGSWPPVQVSFIIAAPSSYSAELRTSGGNISVAELRGHVRAHTSGGNVELGSIGGDVDASTSGGNLSLADGRGAVKMHTSGGGIALGRASGPVDVHTSGGNIRMESVENSVHASTSGGSIHARIAGSIREECSLRTSGGNVAVVLDPSAAYYLDAATSGGSVDAEGLTITIAKGGLRKSHLEGDVNGGGPLVRLSTSGGNIEIRTR